MALGKALPSVQKMALGKAFFAVTYFAMWTLPSAALGKAFVECHTSFAECLGHSAKQRNLVVHLTLNTSYYLVIF